MNTPTCRYYHQFLEKQEHFKICNDCNLVYKASGIHRHEREGDIIIKQYYCNSCKKNFSLLECTCLALITGAFCVSGYIPYLLNKIICGNCRRYLIFKDVNLPKFNWEIFIYHQNK